MPSPRGGQTRRRKSYLCHLHQRIQLAFVLREVCRVGVWAADGWRALEDGSIARRTNLELRKFVVRGLHSVPWVAVASGNSLSRLYILQLSQFESFNHTKSLPERQFWDLG